MKIEKILKSIWDEFIYGGHLQSLGAASIVFVSGILLKIQITWDILFITYLMVCPIYLYNRFKEINIDYFTNPERTRHLRSYVRFMPTIFYLIVFFLIISLIYFSNLWVLIFGLFLVTLGLLYTAFIKKSTKRIIFFKNIYVSISFVLLPFFLAAYYSYSVITVSILSLSLFIFIKAFLMQIFLDIKDIESDKKERLQTFPIAVGIKKTLIFLSVFNVIATITLPIFFSFYLNIFPKLILMLIFTLPFDFYCYKLAKKQKYLGYILQSGEFILWPLLILLGEIIL